MSIYLTIDQAIALQTATRFSISGAPMALRVIEAFEIVKASYHLYKDGKVALSQVRKDHKILVGKLNSFSLWYCQSDSFS